MDLRKMKSMFGEGSVNETQINLRPCGSYITWV